MATVYYCVRSCARPGLRSMQGRRYGARCRSAAASAKATGIKSREIKLAGSAVHVARHARTGLTEQVNGQSGTQYKAQGGKRKIKGAQQVGRLLVDVDDWGVQCR